MRLQKRYVLPSSCRVLCSSCYLCFCRLRDHMPYPRIFAVIVFVYALRLCCRIPQSMLDAMLACSTGYVRMTYLRTSKLAISSMEHFPSVMSCLLVPSTCHLVTRVSRKRLLYPFLANGANPEVPRPEYALRSGRGGVAFLPAPVIVGPSTLVCASCRPWRHITTLHSIWWFITCATTHLEAHHIPKNKGVLVPTLHSLSTGVTSLS
jgi:hypothetical protein